MKSNFLFVIGLALIFSACTKNKGEVSMTYNKATAVYGDIDAVRATALTAPPKSIDDPGKIFIGDDFILIGEENEGIHVYDNNDPSNPVSVGFIQLPFTKEFYVDKNYVYAESQYDFLKIDISDLSAPTLVDRVEYAFGDPIMDQDGNMLLGFDFDVVTETFEIGSPEAMTLQNTDYLYYDYLNQLIPPSSVPSSFAGNSTEIKGTLNKIALLDDYVYVIGNDRMHTFQDGASAMAYIGNQYVSNEMETIYPEGNNLFIGTQTSMVVLDATNPENPYYLSEYFHPTSCDPVLPHGSVAYLTLRAGAFGGCSGDDNTLVVLNIDNLNNPSPIQNIPMNSPYGMCIIDNKLYVGEGANGLAIFDVTDPQNPVHLTTEPNEVYDIMEHPTIPNMILTTSSNGLELYQVDANPMDITFLSSINY